MQQEMVQAPVDACQHEDDYPIKPNGTSTVIGSNINGGHASYRPRSFFTRHRKALLTGTAILTLGAVAALVSVLVIKPWNLNDDASSSGSEGPGGHGKHQGALNSSKHGSPSRGGLEQFTTSSSVMISNSVRCNDYTPSLDQPFLYGQQPIRGVNLGGWLVLEPFITPSMFEPYLAQNVTDEFTLSQFLGPEKAKAQLEKHYASWVTEDTFKHIRDLGLNHVRIPIGFWALGDMEADEPYVPDLALDYLLQGLRWAAKYGIRAMVELHAAPGSQNGWNHSGHGGKINWMNGTPEGEKNGKRTLAYTKKLVKLLQGPGMEHVSPMYGILNEPAVFMLERPTTDQWYKDAFQEMRSVTGQGKGQWGVLHDGFLGLGEWEGFMPGADRVALDVHQYLIFDHDLIRLSRQAQVNFSCDIWSKNMQRSTLKFGPTVVGEFSSATNDCAKYLNGVGVGYRWDGTFDASEPAACQPKKNAHIEGYCSCDAQNRVETYTPEYRKFLSEFTQTQMDAFEQGLGWFYWNFKTETNALWSYFDGVEQGWIPKDANNRPGGCKALGRDILAYTENVEDTKNEGDTESVEHAEREEDDESEEDSDSEDKDD